MSKFTPVPRAGAALALALSACLLAPASHAQTPPAPPASAASAPAESARPEVGVLLEASRNLNKEGKYAESLEKLKEAQAIPNLSAYEQYFIDRMRAAASLGAGDVPATLKSLESARATGRLKPEEQLDVDRALSDLYFRSKDYPHSIEAAKRYVAGNGTDPAVRNQLVVALYLNGQYDQAAPELLAQVKADEAAGRPTSEQLLRMLASSQVKLKDDAGYTHTLELLVARFPKPDLWADLIFRTESRPGFSDHLRLDVYRLKVAAHAMTQAPEYVEMAQLALQGGFPAEAQRVLDEGYAHGLLGTGAGAKTHQQLRDQAKKAAAADAASLAQAAAGGGNRDGNALVQTGFALATAGQADKGVPLMQQGLAKGGVKRPEDAKLHLGIAQWMAGQGDAAVATFKTVSASDGSADLARLWSLAAKAPQAAGPAASAPAKP